ncbi:alpha/beta hydrolase [Streptomyces sp. NBC_01549]|uniref:alpha/beta hydrolase n=1 Tax=Streptomyces sp. NBC_01549 TaxID=2975874 RepID=UPI00225B8623|nr:alpha/beta hydrolase [Streptomyces sp. NBC_01549]MCX4588216.1 alpha/beta hydrolase [Streptomyces sp. NBC_01549]
MASQPTVARAVLRSLFALPRPLKRALAGPPRRCGEHSLDLDFQFGGRLLARGRAWGTSTPLAVRRELTDDAAPLLLAPETTSVTTGAMDIPAPDGRVLPARLYRPPAAHGLLVFLHGGGFTTGSLASADPLCRLLAHHAGVRVLSVGYRLAPEHPYPAGLDDAVTAYGHVLENRVRLGLGAEEGIAVGGDSAGGNLALETAIATYGRPGPDFALALYPVADIGRTGGSRALFAEGMGLTAEAINEFEQHYLPDGYDAASPGPALVRRGDLGRLPPTYLSIAGFDPLRDEADELAGLLRAERVPLVARAFPSLPHAYAAFAALSPAAHTALLDAAHTLRDALRRPVP